MTGIFDSGAGGLAALCELRRLLPNEDIVFYADAKNAPYGTKSTDEIVRLAESNVRRLRSAGADRVLIACCTASACFGFFDKKSQKSSVPIIAPTAEAAVNATVCGKIAVIATELTVRLHAFSEAIRALSPDIEVLETAAQPLVAIAERIARGISPTREEEATVCKMIEDTKNSGADTLVLGCTHFSHLENTIKKYLNGIITVDSARVGAGFMARYANAGCGKTLYLE